MDLVSLFLLAFALAMDAFAVCVCKGLSANSIHSKDYMLVGAYFGGFQALMPLLGYALGVAIADYIEAFDHWVAFLLLVCIGIKMLKDARNAECIVQSNPFRMRSILPLAIATSIDALAIGISFAFLETSIMQAVVIIGIVTALLCVIGLRISKIDKFTQKLGGKAYIIGGVVLIMLGFKILFTHLFS